MGVASDGKGDGTCTRCGEGLLTARARLQRIIQSGVELVDTWDVDAGRNEQAKTWQRIFYIRIGRRMSTGWRVLLPR